jgi:hypothetical protein
MNHAKLDKSERMQRLYRLLQTGAEFTTRRIKRLLCKHEYETMGGLMGFFGKTQCHKCGKISNLPEDQMTTSTFSIQIGAD